MENQTKFKILLSVAWILAMLVLVFDWFNISQQSWTITYMAIIIGLISVLLVMWAMNIRWPSDLTKVLSLCFMGLWAMILMIEGVKYQWLFTEKFILGCLIFCITITAISLTSILLWPKKDKDMFDIEIIEVKPMS